MTNFCIWWIPSRSIHTTSPPQSRQRGEAPHPSKIGSREELEGGYKRNLPARTYRCQSLRGPRQLRADFHPLGIPSLLVRHLEGN